MPMYLPCGGGGGHIPIIPTEWDGKLKSRLDLNRMKGRTSVAVNIDFKNFFPFLWQFLETRGNSASIELKTSRLTSRLTEL